MVERKLTGAHYGLGSWLMQRVTALLMIVYTLILVLMLLFSPHDYEAWRAFFAQSWVRLFTQLSFIALALHAWVGIRDLWMDYIKCAYTRIFLHTATIVWLAGCLIYSVKIIWGV